LIVKPDGSLVVRAPLHTPDLVIRLFVESKARWINTHRVAAVVHPAARGGQYADGQEFWYLGRQYPLKIDPSATVPLAHRHTFILSQKALPRARAAFTRWYRAQALRVITERVQLLAARHGLTYHSIKITSAQTRWGSCSAKNTLNFPWRLVMAPLEVIDYVVVHELAHTREKNHGRGFWTLVKSMMPDYEVRKQWLKENGGKLRLG
jgi:hypothetical protein